MDDKSLRKVWLIGCSVTEKDLVTSSYSPFSERGIYLAQEHIKLFLPFLLPPKTDAHHPQGTSFSEDMVWQCRLRSRSVLRTFWLVFFTALDISCQEYCTDGNCQTVPSLLPYVIANKSCGLDSSPNMSVWMDGNLLLFAYPEHRRRHDQVNVLSTAKFKPRSWLNDQKPSSNILPVTVKIAHGVNEPSTVAFTKLSTECKNCHTKVYSHNCVLAVSLYLPFSTFASRCRSGNHTRHCGGGSDMRVSKKVFNVTFFCSNKQTNMHKKSVIRHLKITLSCLYRNSWEFQTLFACSPDLVKRTSNTGKAFPDDF